MPPARRRTKQTALDRVMDHALSKPGAWLDHPWSEDHDVVKVGAKMFVTVGSQDEMSFAIRHEDMDAREEWRDRWPDAITSAPYMPNKPWSKVWLDRGIDEDDAIELVEESYLAVCRRLAKKDRPDGWDADLAD